MLHNKNEEMHAFKTFKHEVKKQCVKQIKIVRSDKVENTLVDTLRMYKLLVDELLVHLQNFFKSIDSFPIHYAWLIRPE